MEAATHDSMPCYAGQIGKSFAFSIRSLSPLSYMGLKLACNVRHFLHGGAIPGHGAFPRWCRRVIPSPLATTEPVNPRTTL
jgi:hypothetical protein